MVRDIMVEDGIEPPPWERYLEPDINWKTFIDTHMDSIVACDFFTKNVYTVFSESLFSYSFTSEAARLGIRFCNARLKVDG